ncbi:MAG: EI24 domain-containing protein [Rhodoferax sp.]|nr:EI24 domain-containing protein [Rhodoferax sp.]
MNLFLDSFWRAVVYCLHPRVVLLSVLPLLLMVPLALGLGYFYWEPAIEAVRASLESSSAMTSVWSWLQGVGLGSLKSVVAPLIVIFAVTPLIVVVCLLAVALLMTPALVTLVAARRFPELERKRGGAWVLGLAWSLGSTVVAVLAMIVSIPFWLVPPLILVLPPLIWGWLTYRVMAYDALAEHASAAERRELFRTHRGWLLGIGVLSGYLGAAPSLIWASGVMFAALFVILIPLAIWIYTLVFAFSSLWFTHYGLTALQALRAKASVAAPPEPGGATETTNAKPMTLSHELNHPDQPHIPA